MCIMTVMIQMYTSSPVFNLHSRGKKTASCKFLQVHIVLKLVRYRALSVHSNTGHVYIGVTELQENTYMLILSMD